ncbi:type III toxin-antitoxin system ToxN/AbiQ family toxin [uncultured Acetatifactor sp.]
MPKIKNNAAEVYKHKIKNGNATALAKRCNDFMVLEEKCKQFKP